jgi:DNA polymerase III epsilon subunit-like protein
MKTIFIDLEISPQESMTYGPFHEASVLSVIRAPYIFCFAYCEVEAGKPIGKPKVVSLTDYSLYEKEPFNDRLVARELHRIISSADIIVAHNISFDMRVATARFIAHGMKPCKPVKTVCTLRMARKIGQFPSNSLKELALFLGVEQKIETSKFLWQKIHIEKDKKAWKEMIKYCAQDVKVGIQIYEILRGWTGKATKPYLNAVCQECGSSKVQRRGANHSKRGGIRFQCCKCFVWGVLYE